MARSFQMRKLLLDVDDDAGTNGTAALADSEAQALLRWRWG